MHSVGGFSPSVSDDLPDKAYTEDFNDPLNPTPTLDRVDSQTKDPSLTDQTDQEPLPMDAAMAAHQGSPIISGTSKSERDRAKTLNQSTKDLTPAATALADALKVETAKLSLTGIKRLFQSIKKICGTIQSTAKPTVSIPSSPNSGAATSVGHDELTPEKIRRPSVKLSEKKTEALETLETVASHISTGLNISTALNTTVAVAAASTTSEASKATQATASEDSGASQSTTSASEISGMALEGVGIGVSAVFIGYQAYNLSTLLNDINDLKRAIKTLQTEKDATTNPAGSVASEKLAHQLQSLKDELETVQKQVKKDTIDFTVSSVKTYTEASSLGVEIAACTSTISQIIAPALGLGAGVMSLGLAIRDLFQNFRRGADLNKQDKALDAKINQFDERITALDTSLTALGAKIDKLDQANPERTELEGQKTKLENQKTELETYKKELENQKEPLLDKIKDCTSNRIQLFASLASSILSVAHSAIIIASIAGTAGLAGAAMATGIGAGVIAGLGIAYLIFRNRKAIGSFIAKTAQKTSEAFQKLLTNMVKGADVVKNQIRCSSLSTLKTTIATLNNLQNNTQITSSSIDNPLLRAIEEARKAASNSSILDF